MSFHTLLYTVQGKRVDIVLNRPEKRNAFNATLVAELREAFALAESDDRVRVIVLRAEGQVFSAGADLGYLQSLQQNSFDENLADSRFLMGLYKQMYTLSKPIIAQIEGHAIAGGCGLATVCDFSFAVPEAQFGYTEVKIGFIPAIVMVFLLRKISERNARQLLLTGSLVSAETAKELGLINDVIDKAYINDKVNALCQDLIEQTSRVSLTSTKRMIAEIQEMSLDDALEHAAKKNAEARATEDCQHGIASFLEKKKPEWK
ncbi:MAG TPA: enoyl-CoA hydratase-related protein [Chitinophagales bacterium]|nr:enoyl-CoA hydratase-related protein [Chitinophagales bacterium]